MCMCMCMCVCRAFERVSVRLAAEAALQQAADAKAAQEKERLEALRRYAASLRNTDGAHVYYFDTNNEFQELGKECKRVVKDDSVLEEGESELVTKVVWVRVPMW